MKKVIKKWETILKNDLGRDIVYDRKVLIEMLTDFKLKTTKWDKMKKELCHVAIKLKGDRWENWWYGGYIGGVNPVEVGLGNYDEVHLNEIPQYKNTVSNVIVDKQDIEEIKVLEYEQ